MSSKPAKYAGGQTFVQVDEAGTAFVNYGRNPNKNKSTYSSNVTSNSLDNQQMVNSRDQDHISIFYQGEGQLNAPVSVDANQGSQGSVTYYQTNSSSDATYQSPIHEDYGKDGSVIMYHSSDSELKRPLEKRVSLGAHDRNEPQRKEILKEFKRRSLTKGRNYEDGALNTTMFAEEGKEIFVQH